MKQTARIAVLTVALSLFVVFGMARAEPIGARAVYVEGEVTILYGDDSAKSEPVAVGTAFATGDRVVTSDSGIVEIEFDTGDLLRVDSDSGLLIRSLDRNEWGSAFSIFELFFGRVKSAVSKLPTPESVFEYYMRAAVTGVAGTPPFVVEFRDRYTSVDLLGEPGDEGGVYVRGFDRERTEVIVPPGFRTVVREGDPPLEPFPISSDRRRRLNNTIPFSTRVRNRLGDAAGPSGLPDTSTGERLAIDTIADTISTPAQTPPEETDTAEGVDEQDTTAEQRRPQGEEAARPTAAYRFRLIFR